jgi:O-antigen ligase
MVVVAVVAVAVGAGTPHVSRLQSIVEWFSGTGVRESSAATRAAMAAEAWDLWLQRPFLGWGFDQYRFVSSRGDYSHSTVMELLVNGGVAAAALYYFAYGFLVIQVWRQWRRTHSREQRLDLAWASMTTLCLFLWSLAAVQYEQKLDAVLLAAVSVAPAIMARTAVVSRGEQVLRSLPGFGADREYDYGR